MFQESPIVHASLNPECTCCSVTQGNGSCLLIEISLDCQSASLSRVSLSLKDNNSPFHPTIEPKFDQYCESYLGLNNRQKAFFVLLLFAAVTIF